MRVLIAEDRPELRRLFARMVSRLGHKATAVATCDQLRRALRWDEFDVVLSDIDLGGEDGLSVLQGAVRPRRVVFMSGDARHAERARQAGFRVLEKPFGLEQLVAALEAPVV